MGSDGLRPGADEVDKDRSAQVNHRTPSASPPDLALRTLGLSLRQFVPGFLLGKGDQIHQHVGSLCLSKLPQPPEFRGEGRQRRRVFLYGELFAFKLPIC